MLMFLRKNENLEKYCIHAVLEWSEKCWSKSENTHENQKNNKSSNSHHMNLEFLEVWWDTKKNMVKDYK